MSTNDKNDLRTFPWCPNCVRFRRVAKFEDITHGLHSSMTVVAPEFLPCTEPEETQATWREFFLTPPRERRFYPTNCSRWAQSPRPQKPVRTNPLHMVIGVLFFAALFLLLYGIGEIRGWLAENTYALEIGQLLRVLFFVLLCAGGVVAAVVTSLRRRSRK